MYNPIDYYYSYYLSLLYYIYRGIYIHIYIFIAKPKKRWFMMVSYFLAVTWGYEDLEEIFATFRCRLGL